MPYFRFLWTPDTIDHIAQHGVTTEEFEQVAFDPEYEEKPHRKPDRVAAFGWAANGKRLRVVYDVLEDGFTCYPVTAIEEDD